MKKIMLYIFPAPIILALMTLLSTVARGQQDPGFTHYMYNTQSVNAAYAGTQEAINIILLSRHQWVGFDGAPQTQTFTVHGPVDKKYIGLGFSYVRDRVGPVNIDNAYFDYSFKVQVTPEGVLSLGLKTGLDLRSNNLLHLNPLESGDNSYSENIEGKLSFNFGTGVYYYTNHYYMGISMPRLRRTKYNDSNADYLNEDFQERHLFIIGGYVWDIDEYWKLKPTFFTKYVNGAPLSVDVNLSAMYRESVVAGVSHRFGDSFGLMMQFRAFGNLWAGYAFDFTTTPLRSHSRGTHEVIMLFDINPRKSESIKSPRFF